MQPVDQASTSDPKTIMLVDDNPDDREELSEFILLSGHYAVREYETGEEALAGIEAHKADCILLDYRLAYEDGLDVLIDLHGVSPLTPIILMTGEGNEEVAAKAIKLGAADYLPKRNLSPLNMRLAIGNAIKQAALRADIADREAERAAFLNILVHDLKAPLLNFRQIGDMLTDELEEGADQKELRKLIALQERTARRAAALITTLEEYALLDGEITVGRVSLSEAAQAARDNLATVIDTRNATVEIGALPTITGNTVQLTQLLQNLIGNGLKYCKEAEPCVSVTTGDGPGVTIVVRDNGIGIPPQYLETIFQPLKRLWTANDYEGTGLGLAICQKVVKRHEAEIWCTSSPGEGSSFYIRFPESALC